MRSIKATSRLARMGRALFPRSWFSYSPLYRIPVLAILCTLCFSAQLVQAGEPVELHSDTQTATAGYFQLRWHWPGATDATIYVLKEVTHVSGEPRTRKVYEGSDLASVISGKPDGVYDYSIRVMDGQQQVLGQSDTVRVIVEHHPLNRAVWFFVLGLIVFVAILFVILRGDAKTKRG